MLTMSLIWEILLDVSFRQMYSHDIVDLLDITPFTYAELMNMEQPQKQKHFKKKFHARKSVISISLSTEIFMNGSILTLTTLAEQQLKSKQSLLKTFSTIA